DRHRKDFEPLASPPQKRLEAMKKMKEQRITTYAFIGPIFPYLTNLEEMFRKFHELKIDYVFCENLNSRAGTWQQVFAVIKAKYPDLATEYHRIFSTKNDYWDRVEEEIRELGKKYKLKTKVYFHHDNS
ncbi:MAG: hypothetical protein V1743_07465, partial [Nanoarchaeota archaeon]